MNGYLDERYQAKQGPASVRKGYTDTRESASRSVGASGAGGEAALDLAWRLATLLQQQAHPSFRPAMALSVVVPVFNEAENLERLWRRLTEVLEKAPSPYRENYEIVLVDDGSTDESARVARRLHRQDPRVRLLQLRQNFGKTAALQAGFSRATGSRVITIDADMQEEPAHILEMLSLIDEQGYDLVSGWRRERNDPRSKTLPSRVFNFVVSSLTGVRLHDFNCGFKAYRRTVIDDLKLYGELHRFVPVLASQRGFRVTEVPVAHQPRQYGTSKFGASRLGHGLLDFIQVLFLTSYLRRPLRLFGSIGLLFFIAGFAISAYLSALWFMNQPIGHRPLLTLGVLLLITGLQFFSTGLVGEMIRATSFRNGDDYTLREEEDVPSIPR